jgi:hypothetical protein
VSQPKSCLIIINMNSCYFYSILLALLVALAQALPNEKVLDMSHAPKLSKTEGSPRSVNLSFFVPAFSLFALASQFLPTMFPSLTTTTSSRRQRQERSLPADHPNNNNNLNWVEEFIRNGLVY